MSAPLPLLHRGFGETLRRDAWWLQPLVVFTILGGFVVYATWAAFQNAHYMYGPYLSPFYSPEIFGDPRTAWFGAQAGLVAGAAAVLAGADHPAVSGAVPLHLLLLSRRVLQGVLGRSAELRRRRAAQELPRRAIVPADPAERPPLLHVRRGAVPLLPRARRVEGALVRGRGGREALRHRRRHARARAQRRAAHLLHARLSLDAPRRRRLPRSAVAPPGAQEGVRLLELPQSLAHEVGVDESHSASRSPTSTCGCARWASGTTGGSSDGT